MPHHSPALRRVVEHAEAAMERLRLDGCVFVEAKIRERKGGGYDLVITAFDAKYKTKH